MFLKKSSKPEESKGKQKNDPGISINCSVEMNVTLPNTVCIEVNGALKGNITADVVIVKGRVKGNILGTEKVILKEEAIVNGQIISKSLQVSEGVEGDMDLKISEYYEFPDLETHKTIPTNKTELQYLINPQALSVKKDKTSKPNDISSETVDQKNRTTHEPKTPTAKNSVKPSAASKFW